LPVTQYRCCDCDLNFEDELELTLHLRLFRVHRPKRFKQDKGGKGANGAERVDGSEEREEKRPAKPECTKCNQTFGRQADLENHLNSLRHKPLSNILCLADSACKKRFVSPSGQLQHLESGHCVSGMTREELNEAIALRDVGGTITSGGATGQWMLDDNLSTSSTSGSQSPILTPTSMEFDASYPPSGTHTPMTTLPNVTDFSSLLAIQIRRTPDKQLCPLCPPSNTRRFKSCGLRDHLTSSVHTISGMPARLPILAPEIKFHCPRALLGEGSKKVDKQFSSVSGLAQHIESGACAGGRGTLMQVVEFVHEELKNLGLGERRLLL
jgi:hypothetical protein